MIAVAPKVAAVRPPVFGEMVDGERHYRLHAGQSRVLRSRARFTAAIAGTGGGKTVIGPLWLMKRIHDILEEQPWRNFADDPLMFMVVAPTYKIMDRVTSKTLVRMFRGTDLEGTWVPSRNVYLLPDGLGEIYCVSADNPQSLEGGQLDGAWLDEGGQLKFDAWIALQGRTGQKQAPIFITTTPYGQNWLFHQFFKFWRGGDPDYFVVQWASNTNPAYSTEEFLRAKKTMSPQRHAMRYEGQFIKMAGLVYPDLDSCVVPANTPVPEDGEDYGGIDFGWNHPFAGLKAKKFIVEDGRDILYVWYERYKRMTPIGQHANAIPKKGRFWADPSRPDLISEMRKADFVVNKAMNDIMVGIDAVNARIYSQRLWISEDCRALIAEGNEYRYPEKDDEVVGEKPVKEFDDAMDALRYLVTGVDRRQIAKSGGHKSKEYDDAA